MCVLWDRLLSWGGKSIEPYGVDYILQKLGFSHARTTIPKWMQRGFMDPLDKVLALLVLHMVQLVREDPKVSSRSFYYLELPLSSRKDQFTTN